MFLTISLGSTVHYELVWSDDSQLPDWDPEKHLVLGADPVPKTVTGDQERRSCNTRKDRDKRQNRHTCGIFIGLVILREMLQGLT